MNNTTLIKPYEISVWGNDSLITTLQAEPQDFLVRFNSTQKQFETNNKEILQVLNYSNLSYYDEYKLAIIGSDQMASLAKVCSPIFSCKTNGEKTLSFTLYTKYWDSEAQDFVENPFIKLLCNERIVKLKYDNEWHDFIIKQIVESSDKKSYTYTAKDRFVQELSKNGFEIVLDTELENNMGTIEELADKILDGSSWSVNKEKTDKIKEKLKEPLYVGQLSKPITLTDMEDETKSIQLVPGETIYLYYKQLISQEKKFLSVVYSDNGFITDQDLVIISDKDGQPIPQYYVSMVGTTRDAGDIITYREDGFTPSFIDAEIGLSYCPDYRGERLVRSQKTSYDSVLKRYVSHYKDTNEVEYKCFTETEYIMPQTTTNIITNSKDFTHTEGWLSGANQTVQTAFLDDEASKIYTIVDRDAFNPEKTYIPVLLFSREKNKNKYFFNTGIRDFCSQIKEFVSGEEYILKINALWSKDGENFEPLSNLESITPTLTKFKIQNNTYSPETGGEIAETIADSLQINSGVFECKFRITKSLHQSELFNRYGFGFNFNFSDIETDNEGEVGNLYLCVKEVQLYKVITYTNENGEQIIATPGGDFSAFTQQYYCLYPANENIDAETFVPSYRLKNLGNFVPVYDETFSKRRAISMKESNRFNLLQELCETFNCWLKIEVEHEDNGQIARTKRGAQIKNIYFKEYVGKEQDAGFKYGINLKSIQRTVDSNQIVSKLIVKNNTNEFGKNGFCTISRAAANPTGENFILNFDHYIKHGLLNATELYWDLYGLNNPQYICYYQKIKTLNIKRDAKIEEQILAARELDEISAELQYIESLVKSAEELKLQTVQAFERAYVSFSLFLEYLGLLETGSPPKELEDMFKQALEDNFALETVQKYRVYEEQINDNEAKLEDLQRRHNEADKRYKDITEELEKIAKQKSDINYKFFNKYSSFVQEGTWNSEDYYDDNLYYLDAENTLYNSAYPKTTYSINVVEISQLPEYSCYNLEIGDRTYIEDTEFFGYVYSEIELNGKTIRTKTPYKEKIVVNQIDRHLDEPSKDKVSVKNYQSQFEDLFQRITAQTQSLQFHEGEYARSAAAFAPGGAITEDALGATMANNNLLLTIGQNKSLTWDGQGFTNVDTHSPNRVMKLVGGKLLLSVDGGETWGTAIDGAGINAQYIRAGQIDTSLIRIMNGDNAAFRWDKDGITAFGLNSIKTGTDKDGKAIYSYAPNPNRFVRFDRYGLYGINNINLEGTLEKPWIPKNLEDIVANAQCGLIQSGLFMNWDIGLSINGDGISLKENDQNRVIIGKPTEEGYGLYLYDQNGKSVLKTIESGIELSGGANKISLNSSGVLIIGNNNEISLGGSGTKAFSINIPDYGEFGLFENQPIYLPNSGNEDVVITKGIKITSGTQQFLLGYNYINLQSDFSGYSGQGTNYLQLNALSNSENGNNKPGFVLGSLGDTPLANRAFIYGSSFGRVDLDGTIYDDNDINARGNNRGYLVLGYHGVDQDGEEGTDSNPITSRISLDHTGLYLNYGEIVIRIDKDSVKVSFDSGKNYTTTLAEKS